MDGRFILSIYTGDSFLYQKIRLAAPEGAVVLHSEGAESSDICIVDVDTAAVSIEGALRISRREGADLKIPLTFAEISALFENKPREERTLSLSEGERAAYLRGEKIKLTELEYSLLSRLCAAHGEFVSKQDILSEVWGDESTPGIINVYIHYLREKLEKYGEKIILSSRKCGYGIDKKYLGGE